MIQILIAGVLAASPGARAPKQTDAVIYLPRVDRTSGLVAFFEHAGALAVLLQPSNWEEEFHPLLPMSPARLGTLTAAGLDPSGSVTVTQRGDQSLTCANLKDPKLFRARMGEALRVRGEPWKARAAGADLVGAKNNDRIVAGYALKDRLECSAMGDPSVESLLKEAAVLVSRPAETSAWKDVATLPGSAFLLLPMGLFGLEGTASHLTAEGKTNGLAAPALARGGTSPYGAMTPSGAVFIRAHVDISSMTTLLGVIESQVTAACPACDRQAVRELAKTLAAQLTGQVVLRVDRLAPGPALKTAADRFFAVKHAYLAELKQPAVASELLKVVGHWSEARKTDSGFVLTVPRGELHLGVVGRHLYFGDDAEAVKALVGAIPSAPAAVKHGADFAIDPKLIGKALSRVSLLDVIGSRELAAAFAVSTELGALLAESQSITGWIDSAGPGSHRVWATWTLAPSP